MTKPIEFYNGSTFGFPRRKKSAPGFKRDAKKE
jgi:hypothetical protein